jgi:hypothetical protein
MFHLAAFEQSIDPAGALTAITAVREEMFFTNGADFRVPKEYPNIIGAIAMANDASASRAQIQSPSLRMIANLDVEPIVIAAVLGNPPEQCFWPDNPVPLTPDEALNFAFLSDPAAAALHYGLVYLSDGPQVPITGQGFTVRCTATVQQVAGAWVNGNLTFAQSLPSGSYQVIGMRCRSTDAVAARLVFPSTVARPGVPVVNAIGDQDPYWTRFGRMGVFGEFPHTNPPTIDVLGGAAAAQTVMLDLVRVR